MAKVHTREEDDGDIAFILSKRRQRRRSAAVKTWVIAGGVALAGMGAIGMAALAVNSVQQSRKANWTHTELAEYLNDQGVSVRRVPCSKNSAYYLGEKVSLQAEIDWVIRTGGDVVLVEMCIDEKEAREKASISENAFFWGRFVVMGKTKLYDQIRAALK